MARIRRLAVAVTAGLAAVSAGAVIGWQTRGSPAQIAQFGRLGPSAAPLATATSPAPAPSWTLHYRSAAPSAKPSPPPRSGWPGPDDTGVPAGARLTVRGSIVVRSRGAVLSNLDVRGDIVVQADNVTIRNTRVVNTGNAEWGILQRQRVTGLTVQDSEVRGNGRDRMGVGILNQGGLVTIRRVDVSVVSHGIDTSQGLIEDSYLHDAKEFPGDHVDMIASFVGPAPGTSLVVRHNTVFNNIGQTAAVALFQDFGLTHDALVENNLLAGGGYTVYGGAGKFGATHNIRIVNNVFSRRHFRKGGFYGWAAHWDRSGRGNEWRGNVWEGTGKPVPPP
jgi:hypothetical protein